jgi:hypothetical protein
MSAAAQHYPRRAGVSLQIGGGMTPTGAATTTIEQRRRTGHARYALVSGLLRGPLILSKGCRMKSVRVLVEDGRVLVALQTCVKHPNLRGNTARR